MAARDYKYIFAWTGKQTGWSYRLTVIPADDVDYTANTGFLGGGTVNCDYAAIDTADLEWEFEKYKLGLCSPILPITFDMERINSDLGYILAHPFIDQSFNYVPSGNWQTFSTIPYSFKSSTTVKLDIKFTGNDTYGSPDFRTVFIGSQKNGVESGYDWKAKTFTIEFTDLLRTAGEGVPSTYLNYLWECKDITIVQAKCLYDWLNRTTSTTGLVILPADSDGGDNENLMFWMYLWSEVENYIEELITIVWRVFMRSKAETAISFSIPMPYYYKQLYDGTGGKGTVLTSGSLYVVGHISLGTWDFQADFSGFGRSACDAMIYGGLFKNHLNKDIPTMWDFLRLIYRDGFAKAFFYYGTNSLISRSVLESTYNTIPEHDLELDNFEPQSEILTKATATYCAADIHENDISIANAPSVQTDTSNNENSEDIQVIIKNLPCDYTVEKHGNSFYEDIVDAGRTTLSRIPEYDKRNGDSVKMQCKWTVHLNNFYYLENPIASITDLASFIRVHEWCNYDLTLVSSDDLKAFAAYVTYGMSDNPATSPDRDDITAVGTSSGKAVVLANLFKAIYSDNYQNKISGKVLLDVATAIDNVYGLGCPWFDRVTAIKSDLTKINPDNIPTLFSDYPMMYNVTKCAIDLKEEVVEFEALSQYEPIIPPVITTDTNDTFSWTEADTVDGFQIQVKCLDGNWYNFMQVSSVTGSQSKGNFYAGTYSFRIRAYKGTVYSVWVYTTDRVESSTLGMTTGLTATYGSPLSHTDWSALTGATRYMCMYNESTAGSEYPNSAINWSGITWVAATTQNFSLTANRRVFFFVYGRDAANNYGGVEKIIYLDVP